MNLSEFLLARIAEEEAAARYWLNDEGSVAAMGYPFGPARVLAECEAKRRIVSDVLPDLWDEYGEGDIAFNPAEKLVRLLALPCAKHPDYNPEWKP